MSTVEKCAIIPLQPERQFESQIGMDASIPSSEYAYEAKHEYALRVNALLNADIIPKGFCTKSQIRIIEKVISCDQIISRNNPDRKQKSEDLDGEYFTSLVIGCLRAKANARKSITV